MAVTGVVSAPLGSIFLLSHARSDELPRLSEDEPTATALQYVHNAASSPSDKRTQGAVCRTCNLIQASQGEWRPCSLFPGKAVSENGWCLGWVAKR
jgi:hypothetical protein